METLKYYIPVSTSSLPHYIGKGILLPSRYYENKPTDPQDQYKGYLILSDRKWAGAADCAIEIVMPPEEQANIRNLIIGSPFYLYNGGIPVSRIVTIHFKDRKQAETTQWNINSVTAFLPDHLITINNGEVLQDVSVPLIAAIEVGLPEQDLTEKAKRYDILLGGLAFLKVAAKAPANFPKDYFAVLAHFNSKIKSEFSKAVNLKQATFDDQLTCIFTNKKSTWSDIQPLIFEEVNMAKVESAARKAKVSLDKKYGLIELENLKRFPNLYMLALLATYGSNKPKNLQDLISGVISDGTISEDKAEEIALVFGLNTRYSGLRNAYNGKELPIKFKLQSQLDYYTIESIYQYTFCGQKESSTFDYIDKLILNVPAPTEPINAVAYWILDTPVLTKKKRAFDQELLEGLRNSYPAFHELLEKAVTNGLQGILVQLNEKDKEINFLNTQLKEKDRQLNLVETAVQVPGNISKYVMPKDDLEQLDFKALKTLAKSKKIPAKSYSDLKPTFHGYSALIALIRSQTTLL